MCKASRSAHRILAAPSACHVLAQLVSQNKRFERVEVTRDEALSMFLENKFKVHPAALPLGNINHFALAACNCRKQRGTVHPNLQCS